MNFRTLFILNRVITPVALVLFGVSMLIPQGLAKTSIQVVIGIPFAAACLWGARLGWRLQRELFIPMRCPLCGQQGEAGRGVTREVGWWLQCPNCGTVKPRGLLGLKFTKTNLTEQVFPNPERIV